MTDNQDAVAIIGLGCRFPGDAEDPQAFWDMLCEGRDGICEVPENRWDIKRFYDPDPNKPGKTYTKHGGYLRQPIDQMDALFFGISPREAENLDPQQRLLLEVAWEAFEDAGLTTEALAGSATGVFIGGFIIDHMSAKTSVLNRDLLNTHSAVSFTHTMLSARIAYTFDLCGPCVTLDTACSSSLVALHQACQSIRTGESDLALVGGVNMMHRVETFITMCKSRFLAKDGRSKSFDARGDGYGRGEGAGIAVLKSLSAAQRDGDLVYAIIRGTGVSQDGRTDGITVPNDKAQAKLIQQVCKISDVDPDHINYLEAHGTGTALGDPKECSALGSVIGKTREAGNGCWVGSVKANIGHLEAAAGIAAFIKTALCLHNRQIPPVANLETPNPAIDFEALGLRLPRQLEPLLHTDKLPLAGINSFGYGGTNAHAILEAVEPFLPHVETKRNGHYFLPLSARSEAALQELANRYCTFIHDNSTLNLSSICWSAATRRSHHHFRLAIIAHDRGAVLQQLDAFAHGQGAHLPQAKTSQGGTQGLVFVFTGMGPQWWRMGQELLQSEPVFLQMAERCDVIFRELSGWSILEEMNRDEETSRIAETQIAQPANFILQASLNALWRSKGIIPTAIVGHSVGEVTAAFASGALSLEDAITVSYYRSQLQKKVSGQGKMLAVALSEDKAQLLLDKYGRDKISFAAINSPTALTLSGDEKSLNEISEELEGQGIFNRFLRVELAYHSPIMESIREEMIASLAELQPRLPNIPLYSTVTGSLVESVVHNADYWYANMRQPVCFSKAIMGLTKYGLFLEVGPHPVLASVIKENLSAAGSKGHVVFSLRRKEPETDVFYRTLGELYTLGNSPDWSTLYPEGGQFVRLPLYPWQRKYYWQESERSIRDHSGGFLDHPLLGHQENTPFSSSSWQQPLNTQFLPWLSDHKVQDLIVLPGAAYVEVGLALSSLITDGIEQASVENVRFLRALVINPQDEPVLHTHYDPSRQLYEIYSCNRDGKSWIQHAEGRLSLVALSSIAPIDLKQIQKRCSTSISVGDLYHGLTDRGLQYGESFQCIQQIWLGKDEVLTRIVLQCERNKLYVHRQRNDEEHSPESKESDAFYRLHPTLLDAVFQSLIGILDENDNRVFVPVYIGQIRVYRLPDADCWGHGQITQRSSTGIEADLCLCDQQGNVLVDIRQLRCQALLPKGFQSETKRNPEEWLYKVDWDVLPAVLSETQIGGRWLLFMDKEGRMEGLAKRCLEEGIKQPTVVYQGEHFKQIDEQTFCLRNYNIADMQALLKLIDFSEHEAVVYGWGLDCQITDDVIGVHAAEDFLNCSSIMHAGHTTKDDKYFFLLTQNAQAVDDNTKPNIAQASLIGLGRVAAAELHLRFRLIDLPDSLENIDSLFIEICSKEIEMEVALRGDQRYAYRVKHYPVDELYSDQDIQTFALHGTDEFVLEEREKGLWQWRENQGPKKTDKQVKIHVEHIVLSARGLNTVGDTLVTVIGQVTTGHNTAYEQGEFVVGLLKTQQLSSYIYLPEVKFYSLSGMKKSRNDSLFERLYYRKFRKSTGLKNRKRNPPTIKYAASLLPFMKSIYALQNVANIKSGEALLIHPSLDNMDLAAAQLGLALKAKVFATYHNEVKRDAFLALGVKHVIPIDTLDFVDAVIIANGGQKIQVVLNTLDGEFAYKSLDLLSPFGRFVDFKKVSSGVYSSASIDNNVSLQHIDIEELFEQCPEVILDLLADVKTFFERDDFKPFDIPVFNADQVSQGMKCARKQDTALEVGAAELVDVLPTIKQESIICTKGSYLITGGFGGFGLVLAHWLAKQGVTSLILVGRRGAAGETAQQAVKDLRRLGVSVVSVAADIGREVDVQCLIEDIQKNHPPLVGIFHAAGVLDDAMLVDLTPERLQTVMQPKAMGAWYLHKQTYKLPLQCFVLFSSISSLVGKPGQGSYVAANAFLDQLAHARCAEGLPGLSLNWGVLADVGMAAEQNVEERLNRIGINSFTGDEAMKMLDLALRSNIPQLGLMNIDWRVWIETNKAHSALLRYTDLIGDIDLDQEGSAQVLKQELQEMDVDAHLEHVCALLIRLIAQIMRLPEDSIDPTISLNDMGLDSLMAAELQGLIEMETSVSLSILDLMQGLSVEQLSTIILDDLIE